MPFVIPDSNAAAIAVQAQPDPVDFQILSLGSAGTGVVARCGVTQRAAGANMSVDVATGIVQSLGNVLQVTAGNVVIGANSSGNPRIDLIVVTSAGALAARAGTAATTPLFPVLTTGDVVLAAVTVPTGAASITTATNIIGKSVPTVGARPSFTLPVDTPTSATTYTGPYVASPYNLQSVVVRVIAGTSVTFNLTQAGRNLFTSGQTVVAGVPVTLTPNVTRLYAGGYLDLVCTTVSGGVTSIGVSGVMSPATPTYPDVVLTDTPLAYYRMEGASATPAAVDNSGLGHALTYTGAGVTYAVTGALTTNPDTNQATTYNGSSGGASVALNLSAYNTIVAEFWLNKSAFANDDQMAVEFTANGGSTTGGFFIDPNSAFYTGLVEISLTGAVGLSQWTVARPSTGWHHWAVVLAYGAAAGPVDSCAVYIDGVAVIVTPHSPVNNLTTQKFASSRLNAMARDLAGTPSLYAAGSMDEVALYGYTSLAAALSSTLIAAHYAAR